MLQDSKRKLNGMTVRRDKPQTQETELLDEKTELLTGEGTLLLDGAESSGSEDYMSHSYSAK